jgi:sorbitol/mannitol transport system permease protein
LSANQRAGTDAGPWFTPPRGAGEDPLADRPSPTRRHRTATILATPWARTVEREFGASLPPLRRAVTHAHVAEVEIPDRIAARHRTRRPRRLLTVAGWILGVVGVFPVLWMVFLSLHHDQDTSANPLVLTKPLTLGSYAEVFGTPGGGSLWPALLNSIAASTSSVSLVLLLAVLAGYALAVPPIRRLKGVLLFFLFARTLPIIAGLLPLYLASQRLDLLDNIWALAALYTGMNLPVAVWMMSSFMAEVPETILQAGRVDGARPLGLLWHVVLPCVTPGLAATTLICFIFSWNEMVLARVLTGVVAGTAPVYLTGFVSDEGLFLGRMCAAATVLSLPVLAAGFAAQRRLVQGLSFGAVQ